MVCGEIAVILKVLYGFRIAYPAPVLAVLGDKARVIEPVNAADAVIERARKIRLGELFVELLLRTVFAAGGGDVAFMPLGYRLLIGGGERYIVLFGVALYAVKLAKHTPRVIDGKLGICHVAALFIRVAPVVLDAVVRAHLGEIAVYLVCLHIKPVEILLPGHVVPIDRGDDLRRLARLIKRGKIDALRLYGRRGFGSVSRFIRAGAVFRRGRCRSCRLFGRGGIAGGSGCGALAASGEHGECKAQRDKQCKKLFHGHSLSYIVFLIIAPAEPDNKRPRAEFT